MSVTHRCSCGKGVRLWLVTHKYRRTELRLFLDPRTLQVHALDKEHYIVGREPMQLPLEHYTDERDLYALQEKL